MLLAHWMRLAALMGALLTLGVRWTLPLARLSASPESRISQWVIFCIASLTMVPQFLGRATNDDSPNRFWR
jgi:hypothetical protein